jgi:hypothetical protein
MPRRSIAMFALAAAAESFVTQQCGKIQICEHNSNNALHFSGGRAAGLGSNMIITQAHAFVRCGEISVYCLYHLLHCTALQF